MSKEPRQMLSLLSLMTQKRLFAENGLACPVPDGGRVGQADGLVHGSEPLEPVIAVVLDPCDQHHRQG